jgi:hypothetical protein
MTKDEKIFLDDTIGILVSYDNEYTIEGLKRLIDETKERLIKISEGEIKKEDLGFFI